MDPALVGRFMLMGCGTWVAIGVTAYIVWKLL